MSGAEVTEVTEAAGRVHRLKTWPEFYEPIRSGRKTFELRFNDRDFRAGDWLHLVEFDPNEQVETGASLMVQVGYMLQGGRFGLEPGHCAMSLRQPVANQPGRAALQTERECSQ